MKSINSIQKYRHIIKSYACILQILFTIFFVYYDYFIFFWNLCPTQKLSKYTIFFALTYKAIQRAPIDSYSTRFITYAPHLLFQVNYFLNKHHQIKVHFDDNFVFQNLLMNEVALKILGNSNRAFICSNCTSSRHVSLRSLGFLLFASLTR